MGDARSGADTSRASKCARMPDVLDAYRHVQDGANEASVVPPDPVGQAVQAQAAHCAGKVWRADLMKQGTLNVMVGGMPAAIDVYDDGLVFVPGSKGAQAGMLFGALGALIGGAAARRGLTKRREQL